MSITHIPALCGLLWDTGHGLVSVVLAINLARAILPLGLLWIPKLILDAVTRTARQDNHGHQHVWFLISYEIALALINDSLNKLGVFYDSILADRFALRVNVLIMEHASTLDLAYFEDAACYDTISLARDNSRGRMALVSAMFALTQDVLGLATLSISLAVVSPWLFLLLICSGVPSLLSESRFTRLQYSVLFRWTPHRRLLDYLASLATSIESAKEVRVFGLGAYLSDAYQSISKVITDDQKALAIRKVTVSIMLGVLSFAGYYSGYAIILLHFFSGLVTIGTLVFLTTCFGRSRYLIERAVVDVTEIGEHAVFLRDFFAFLQVKPTLREKSALREIPLTLRVGLELQGVSFTYPGALRPTLSEISFCIGVGESVAFVGENGAGKSTLAKLILRLYEPSSGVILLDGVDIKSYALDQIYNLCGTLFQDYVHYDLTVRDNIGFGDVTQMFNEERIETSARMSFIEDRIQRMPRNYDQMLGHKFDGGISLSGGEWQRIALARAQMRASRLLVLDEPTAALDARKEHELFLTLAKTGQDRMLILITHRLSSVRFVDQILVLQGGRITERGRHEELMELESEYAALFRLQASAYQ